MGIRTYYNELDPFAAQWLRNLIEANLIAPGDVDERSIEDVRPEDLRGYTQCHFFAGLGAWSHALRQAGWSDSRGVWTGSCPCQPFSTAGKRGGVDDERHLWPHFHYLIAQCRPNVVFGEQVASKDGLAWLDLVQSDLEGTGYASGAFDLCAAGVGAPHIRQRLYWVGERVADTSIIRRLERGDAETVEVQGQCSERGWEHAESELARELSWRPERLRGDVGGLGDTLSPRLEGHAGDGDDRGGPGRDDEAENRPVTSPGCTNGFWRDCDWLPFRDSKIRPVEPGTLPLVDGAPGIVGRLRAYGNAIVAPLATEFIKAYMETVDGR